MCSRASKRKGGKERSQVTFQEPVLSCHFVFEAGSLLLFLLLYYLGQFPTVPLFSMSHLTAGTGCMCVGDTYSFMPSNLYIHSGTILGQIFMATAFIC